MGKLSIHGFFFFFFFFLAVTYMLTGFISPVTDAIHELTGSP